MVKSTKANISMEKLQARVSIKLFYFQRGYFFYVLGRFITSGSDPIIYEGTWDDGKLTYGKQEMPDGRGKYKQFFLYTILAYFELLKIYRI